MKISKLVKKVIEVEEVEDILCNKCGNSCKLNGSPYGLLEYDYSGGYDSTPLRDCTTYTFSMCETCLLELFKSFVIAVKLGSYGGFETDDSDVEMVKPKWQI